MPGFPYHINKINLQSTFICAGKPWIHLVFEGVHKMPPQNIMLSYPALNWGLWKNSRCEHKLTLSSPFLSKERSPKGTTFCIPSPRFLSSWGNKLGSQQRKLEVDINPIETLNYYFSEGCFRTIFIIWMNFNLLNMTSDIHHWIPSLILS